MIMDIHKESHESQRHLELHPLVMYQNQMWYIHYVSHVSSEWEEFSFKVLLRTEIIHDFEYINLVSIKAPQNINFPVLLNISLNGGLGIGLLRSPYTFVQVHTERKWHGWEIYQDLLQNIEENLVIQKWWHHFAGILFLLPSSTSFMK